MIPPGGIIPFVGSADNIPAGFSRVVYLNGRFLKAWSDELLPGAQGGSDNHAHTSPPHTHPINSHAHSVSIQTATRGNWGSDDCTDGSGGGADHNHGGATTTTATVGGALQDSVEYKPAPSLPPFFEVIWIKSNGWNAIPSGAIIVSDQEALAGLTFCNGDSGTPDLRGKYLRGAVAGLGSGAVGGSLTHEHDVSHQHTPVPHNHTGTTPSSGGGGRDASGSIQQVAPFPHTHPFTLQNQSLAGDPYTGVAGSAEQVEPAFVKLKFFQNRNAQRVVPSVGIMIFWESLEAPVGWELVSELMGKYIKGADSNEQIGDEGGSNTHSHAPSNAHAHGSAPHTHPQSNTASVPNSRITNVGGTSAIRQHSHQLTAASQTATWQEAQIQANPSSNEPLHTVLSVIKMIFPTTGGASVVPRFL